MKGSSDASSHARSESSVPLLPYAEQHRPSTPLASPSLHSKFGYRQPVIDVQRRRYLFLAGAVLSVVSVMALAMLTIGRTARGSTYVVSDLEGQSSRLLGDTIPSTVSAVASSLPSSTIASPEALHETIDEVVVPSHSPNLLGPPTDRFRDNLRNDTKYITSWISAGWSKSRFYSQYQN